MEGVGGAAGRRMQMSISPRLPQLRAHGAGPHRLLWLGQVKRSRVDSPTGFTIEAYFTSKVRNTLTTFSVDVPLEDLPYLALGSIWKNQTYSEVEQARMRWVTIDMRRFHGEAHRMYADVNPLQVLPASVLRLAHVDHPMGCRILPLADGSELVVPVSEILRSQYLFHPKLVAPFVNGALAFPENFSVDTLPWRPGLDETFYLTPTTAMITYPQWVSLPLALRVARVVLDSRAVTELSVLHRTVSTQALRAPSTAFALPSVMPAIAERGAWRVRCTEIPTERGKPPRLLALSIAEIDQPLPYEHLVTVALNDNRKGAEADSPLSGIHRQRTQLVLPEEEGLYLHGSSGDSALELIQLAGLEVSDNAMRVPTSRLFKDHQGFQSVSVASGQEVEVSAVALSATGIPMAGRPEVSGVIPADPKAKAPGVASSEILSLSHMKPVFDATTRKLRSAPEMADWTIEPFAGIGLLRVAAHNRPARVRPFLVLHIHKPGRNAYLVDAGRLVPSEKMSTFLGETLDGVALTMDDVTQWLGGFPYKVSDKWQSPRPDALLLEQATITHQPRPSVSRGGAPLPTEQQLQAAFVARLVPFIINFLIKG